MSSGIIAIAILRSDGTVILARIIGLAFRLSLIVPPALLIAPREPA